MAKHDLDIPLLRKKESIFSIQKEITELTTEEMQKEIQRLFSDFNRVFSSKTERIKASEHVIKMKNTEPFKGSYPIPMEYKAKVQRQVSALLEQGIIRKAQIEYISTVVVTKGTTN